MPKTVESPIQDKVSGEAEFPVELLDRIIQDVVRSAKHRYLEAGSSARQSPQSAKNKIEQHLNRHNR